MENKNKININNDFLKYIELFLEENSKHNLISKNDEKFLYEKHIYDSLCIKLFFEKYNIKVKNLLDIGTGGGFPAVPIAIEYNTINVTAIDSIKKKINCINNIKNGLKLNNLHTICDRVENINTKFDIITTRAVGKLSKICEYALPLLNNNGYFVAYKSKKYMEEISEAKPILNKFGSKVVDIIEYSLPLNDVFERCLVIIQ